MSVTTQSTTTRWSGTADAAERAHWREVAERVAAELATDALQRDRANQDPTVELDLLRDSGLVNLLQPAANVLLGFAELAVKLALDPTATATAATSAERAPNARSG